MSGLPAAKSARVFSPRGGLAREGMLLPDIAVYQSARRLAEVTAAVGLSSTNTINRQSIVSLGCLHDHDLQAWRADRCAVAASVPVRRTAEPKRGLGRVRSGVNQRLDVPR